MPDKPIPHKESNLIRILIYRDIYYFELVSYVGKLHITYIKLYDLK